jgi:hypothetical protein
MFFGTHLLLYSKDAAADRAFFRDTLEIAAVDAGEGWLILSMPPAEMGIHPAETTHNNGEGSAVCTLYLMCRDLNRTLTALKAKGVNCGPVQQAGWGTVSTIPLPGGKNLGIYEPRHALAIAAE